MCMRLDRRYKGRSTKQIVAWKVFQTDESERNSLTALFAYFRFKRHKWNRSSRGPGFHVYKTKQEAMLNRPSWCKYVVRRVRIKGLLGESPLHYTARYLWVN